MAGQGKTKEIFSKGASVLYSTDMHEQDVSVYAHKSADEIKLLRRNAKRRRVLLIKKIKLICEERGSRSELRVNRQFLVASQEEIWQLNEALSSKSPEEDTAGYQQEIDDDRVSECFRIISDYFQSRLEDEESAASVRSRLVDDHSQTSRGSPTSQSRLREATERLEIARLELQQSEQRLSLVKSQAAREDEELAIESASSIGSTINKRRFRRDAGWSNSVGIGHEQQNSCDWHDPPLVPVLTDTERIPTHRTNQSKAPTSDRWIEETAPSAMQRQTTGYQQLRLEPFDGDVMKWPDFAAGFRALVHDIAQSDYQRMALLRSYLTPSVRSSITQQLSDPSQYWEALRSLKETYGHPILVTNAYLKTMTKLPVVRPEDTGSLQRFVNQMTDAIRGLERTVNAKEINSTALLQMILAKLPKSIRSEWGRRVLKLNRQLDHRDLRLAA